MLPRGGEGVASVWAPDLTDLLSRHIGSVSRNRGELMPSMKGWQWLILIALSLLPAAVPIVIAYVRKTTNRTAVLLVALLTSWTCIGWVAAVELAIDPDAERVAGT